MSREGDARPLEGLGKCLVAKGGCVLPAFSRRENLRPQGSC